MPITIRDVREHELDSVVAVNNAAGASILPMDLAKARFFWEHADYFRVVEQDGVVSGFLVALGPDAPHDSPNFQWFRERYADFLYIDRIVIARPRRGGGRGRAFYADVQSFAEVRRPLLACEVFLQSGNDPALLFHGQFGFREVGQNVMGGSEIRASMLLKEMCSYPYVAETYGGKLPEAAWLRARTLPGRPASLAAGA
ncbi:MAG TPA: GNAT family N-acetyltransferase [Arenimonas sp.]|nr:GNAT family N-acetyltransferase [Arenimonas sp.]